MKTYFSCLLIDDDFDDQDIFIEAMKSVFPNMVCHTAFDASSARKVLSRGLSPDCIFLDLNMPGVTGFQFLKELKQHEQFKDIPVIIHSTSIKAKDREVLMQLGAFGVHIKECTFAGLCQMIDEYLSLLVKHP